MPSHNTSYIDLLIVGAGPAGLMAACWAAQYSNMSTRIIDQKASRTPTGHADGLQCRTLEILDSFGIVDSILRQGIFGFDECYWTLDRGRGAIERRREDISGPEQESRFKKVLLNQGAVEQAMIDYLNEKQHVLVEWHTRAESLHVTTVAGNGENDFPVVVGIRKLGEDNTLKIMETIHARYLIACDGAHSWAGDQLGVQNEGASDDSTWGVLDIIPITDFPDIRKSCVIQAEPYGSVMTLPRENRLVRFYIHLKKELESGSMRPSDHFPHELADMVESIMKPYKLTFRHCDWWSLYRDSIWLSNTEPMNGNERSPFLQIKGRRKSKKNHKLILYSVFLAGDAAHTHSPKGGQGMNVSIQDTYNLGWKLAAVITEGADPSIIETYDTERRPVAVNLMTLDSQLVDAYEQEESSTTSNGIDNVRERYAGFMAGVDVTYSHNILVAELDIHGSQHLAQNIKQGMRLPSFPLVYQCDGTSTNLAQRLISDGSWRLLVFSGDLRQPERIHALSLFAENFSKHSQMKYTQAPRPRPTVEPLLIQSNPRAALNLLDLPEMFHPFDEFLGWDYWKVFAEDDSGQAYKGYGIDKEGPGCLVLCRPDQHVAWIGGMQDVAGFHNYFSRFLTAGID